MKKDFTFNEINIIDWALESLKEEIEERIEKTREVIKSTGEYSEFSRTMDDKYTTDEIRGDLEIIQDINKLLKKINK
ncbi:MAG: hypothetical protein ACRCYE_05960 [Sarcina sp.]